MDYKGFLIASIRVFTENSTRSAIAYQIIHPVSKLIFGTYSCLDRAQQAIDKNGVRWLKS